MPSDGSSPASIRSPAVERELARGYAGLASTGFNLVALGLNYRLTPGTDLWIPRELDVKEICEPLGRIAARHAPMDAGASSDLADAAGAVVGVAGYVQHNFTRIAQLQAGLQTDTPQRPGEQLTPDPAPHVQPQPQPPSTGPVTEQTDAPADGPWSPAADAPTGAGFHDVYPPPAGL